MGAPPAAGTISSSPERSRVKTMPSFVQVTRYAPDVPGTAVTAPVSGSMDVDLACEAIRAVESDRRDLRACWVPGRLPPPDGARPLAHDACGHGDVVSQHERSAWRHAARTGEHEKARLLHPRGLEPSVIFEILDVPVATSRISTVPPDSSRDQMTDRPSRVSPLTAARCSKAARAVRSLPSACTRYIVPL